MLISSLKRLLRAFSCVFCVVSLTSAQDALKHVSAGDGVELAIPAAFHENAGANSGIPELTRVLSDDGSPPIQLFLLRDEAQPSLPEASARLSQAYANGFAQALAAKLTQAELYDVTPGAYDPDRGAFSLQFKTRAASPAKQAQELPLEHALWDPVRAAGNDPGTIKCLVSALLGKANALDASELRARYAFAAHSCGWSPERVEQYVSDTGTAVFAPTTTVFTSIAVFTRGGLIQLLLAAPAQRGHALASLTDLLWSSLRVSPEAQLGTSLWDELTGLTAAGVGQLLGTALGASFALLLWAAGLAWAFSKLGASSALGVYLSAALLLLWSGLGVARTGSLPLTAAVQLASYVLAALLVLRPLTRWVNQREAR